MTKTFLKATVAVCGLILLGACADTGRDWPERGFLLTGDQAIPLACVDGYGRSDGALPLGCANELNLARMAEQPSDLVTPRRPGPAFAEPVAAAAEAYLGLSGAAGGTGGADRQPPNVERIDSQSMPGSTDISPASP